MDAEEKILKPILNGEKISRWLIYSHRVSVRELIKRPEYRHLENIVEQSIESAEESL